LKAKLQHICNLCAKNATFEAKFHFQKMKCDMVRPELCHSLRPCKSNRHFTQEQHTICAGVTSYSPVEIHRRLIYVIYAINTSHLTNIKLCLLLSYLLDLISTVEMEVTHSFETSVNSYNTTWQFSYMGDYSTQRM
jgi:hypothetical protein